MRLATSDFGCLNCAMEAGSVNWIHVPWWGVLSATQILPPCRSTKSRQRTVPIPDPSSFPVPRRGGRDDGSEKSLTRSSSDMPTPVSMTDKRIVSVSSFWAVKSIKPPGWVNLMLFMTRLRSTVKIMSLSATIMTFSTTWRWPSSFSLCTPAPASPSILLRGLRSRPPRQPPACTRIFLALAQRFTSDNTWRNKSCDMRSWGLNDVKIAPLPGCGCC
mmetsp:Transcript_8471/g.16211  ORF Transcript_8471/g.16211 Transcript_8471/m.16211 type:complete len:217 (+) Transcript_8471:131-781(+)